MTQYFATFIPGFKVVVASILTDFPEIHVERIEESGVLFQTEATIPYDLATYVFLSYREVLAELDTTVTTSPENIVKDLLTKLENIQIRRPNEAFHSFRIMVQQGSKLIHIPRKTHKKVEDFFTAKLKAPFAPLKAEIEVWFSLRTEGKAYVSVKRLKKPVKRAKKLMSAVIHQGELRPQMVFMLLRLAGIKATDTILDPFCGYGAIPALRTNWPYRKIVATDVNRELVEQTSFKLIGKKNCVVKQDSINNLHVIQQQEIDVIVTDPPWGMYEGNIITATDLEKIYTSLFSQSIRVLKPGGIFVLLSAQHELVSSLGQNYSQLSLVFATTTLVNGKKAGVWKYILK